jgi:hypothetical protein
MVGLGLHAEGLNFFIVLKFTIRHLFGRQVCNVESVYGSALARKNRHSFAARLCALRLKRNLLMFALEYFMRGNNNCAPPSVMPTQGGK